MFLSMNYSNWEIPQQNTVNMVGKHHVLPTKTHDHMDSGCKRWFHLQVSQLVWWFPECLLILLYQKMCTTDFHDSPGFSLPICYQLRNLFIFVFSELLYIMKEFSENNWVTQPPHELCLPVWDFGPAEIVVQPTSHVGWCPDQQFEKWSD